MAKNLEERVKELEKEVARLKGKAVLKITKNLSIGDTFEIAGIEWKILDITEKGYVCMADKLENSRKFDSSCNNWQSSDLRTYLNTEFFKILSAEIGEGNIITFERNLFSLDGQIEYGTCKDKVSIISFDEYRKYRQLIPNAGYTFWTLTPDSTKCNGDSSFVRVVSPVGGFINWGYDIFSGVRPFCIFSSSIFESEE